MVVARGGWSSSTVWQWRPPNRGDDHATRFILLQMRKGKRKGGGQVSNSQAGPASARIAARQRRCEGAEAGYGVGGSARRVARGAGPVSPAFPGHKALAYGLRSPHGTRVHSKGPEASVHQRVWMATRGAAQAAPRSGRERALVPAPATVLISFSSFQKCETQIS
jgi:hypothetical protein